MVVGRIWVRLQSENPVVLIAAAYYPEHLSTSFIAVGNIIYYNCESQPG